MRINFLTGNFLVLYANECLRMTTSCFFYKMLEKHLWNSLLLYLPVEILQLVNDMSSFSGVIYKKSVPKNFSKLTKTNTRSRNLQVFCQKMLLKILQNSRKNIFGGVSFLIKLQFWGPAIIEKTLTHMLSCKICKTFKNNYLEEHLCITASKLYLKRDSNTGVFLWILKIIQENLFCRASTNGCFWNTSVGSNFNKVASLIAWRL